jgi:hypothetical protein
LPLIITFLFFLTLSPLSAWADFDGEIPPSIMSMLDDASTLENKGTNNTFWKAAQKYCEASRAGNTEAQYRLGILYAFGRGVPQNRVYAATLFSIASNQGHLEAFNMLETVNLDAHSPPPCVIASIDPEIGDHFQSALDSLNNPINNHLKDYLAKLPKEKKWVLDLVESTSEWYEIDPKLVLSVIAIESNFNLNAKSNANAQGLMQLIPQTANRFNVKNAFDASQNVKGGVKYLKWLINRYQGNVELAIAAYNAGEKSVDRHHGIPPFKETIQYVKKFQNLYQKRFHPYQINP